MAHFELADGVFIEYTTSTLGGKEHCASAELDCTFENIAQMKEATDLVEELGLDDDVSFIMHVNENVFGIYLDQAA